MDGGLIYVDAVFEQGRERGLGQAREFERHERAARKDHKRLAERLAGKEFRDALRSHLFNINSAAEVLAAVKKVQLEFCKTN